MIVDSHVHILPDRVRQDVAGVAGVEPWFGACHARGERVASAETLLATMDRDGVDVAVCFAWPFADPALCREANDYVAAAARRHRGRLLGFGVVQPLDPGAPAEVRRCARLGLRGIGEMNADAQGWSLAGGDADAAVAASIAAMLPWTLHCSEPVGHAYPGKGTATPDLVMDFARRHPDLTLICAHLGGGLPLLAPIPEVRDVVARLHFDTAAQPFVYSAEVFSTLVALIGAGGLLLGSDHPLLDVPRYARALSESGIDAASREAVMGGNAARLFGL